MTRASNAITKTNSISFCVSWEAYNIESKETKKEAREFENLIDAMTFAKKLVIYQIYLIKKEETIMLIHESI